MSVPALYAIVVLVWGSTWFAIRFQLGVVAEEMSVAYRFAIAAICLFAFAKFEGRSLKIDRKLYPYVIAQGLLMFSIAYILVYVSTNYVTTGLIALLYSLIVIFNGALERLFYGTPFDARLAAASCIGLSGTALVFWPEVSSLSLDNDVVVGIGWTVISVLIAALGNMAAIRNTAQGTPVILINAHGMLWGAGLTLIIGLFLKRPVNFSFDWPYVTSLLYLAVIGSCVAFGCFMALLKQIGAARASYASVLFPVVALLISTAFEDYRWTTAAIAGVLLILGGNWLALSRVPARNNNE